MLNVSLKERADKSSNGYFPLGINQALVLDLMIDQSEASPLIKILISSEIGSTAGFSTLKPLERFLSRNKFVKNSLDLAVALGVLHHIPNPKQALAAISSKLKPGGTLLGYIYYSLENRPLYYKMIWKLTDVVRNKITNLPFRLKYNVCNLIAMLIYFPLARANKVLIQLGIVVKNWPLSHYSNLAYKVMRNDALDRFGTKIEYRFSKQQITEMLIYANFDLSSIQFSPNEPYWTFSAKKILA